MRIEFNKTDNLSEVIPDFFMTEDLSQKIGTKAVLQWLLVESNNKEIDEQEGVLYQEIVINHIGSFPEKLNSTFFEQIANEFKLESRFESISYLIFKLHPIAPPKQNSRLSWWEGNIVCVDYKKEKWEISEEKIFLWNEIYDKVLMQGEIKIKNDS